MVRRVGLIALASVGCHVVTTSTVTRPAHVETVVHPEGAVARKPTVIISEVGTLRFVEPLDCPTEKVTTNATAVEYETRPNLATFVVGVIATAVGGVMTVTGVAGKDSVANPFTFGGVGLLAIGLPLAIGPWTGLHGELKAGPAAPPLREPGPSTMCGARAFGAHSATITIRGIEVHGTVAEDGTFSVSPYALLDAYQPAVNAWDIGGLVDADGGVRTIDAVIDGSALARHAQDFLDHADFDAKVEPLRLVPGIVPGTLRTSLTSTAAGPALRIVLPLKNDGPGEAWGVRGQITSPMKSVDGRVIYVGHLAKNEAATRELLIPLTVAAADALRGSSLDISIELRDAWGTAPTTPVRYRGDVLVDAPR